MAKITWYGHAAFQIDLAGKILLVDPMLNGNPNSPIKASEITKADAIYVTHDHPDHLGDAFEICKNTGALFAAVYELAEFATKNGVSNVARLNVGGSISGRLKTYRCAGCAFCVSRSSNRRNHRRRRHDDLSCW